MSALWNFYCSHFLGYVIVVKFGSIHRNLFTTGDPFYTKCIPDKYYLTCTSMGL